MYASPFTPNTEDYHWPGRASRQRKVVNPGWSWPGVDTGCTCEASQPRWKSSPGRGGPGGPLTSGSLEGSKGGQPTALKHQRTLLNLNGPGRDAHVKNKDILHYRRKKEFNWNGICTYETKLGSALLHTPWCCSIMTSSDGDPHLRDRQAWQHLWAVVWAHTPVGRGGSCFHLIATNATSNLQ